MTQRASIPRYISLISPRHINVGDARQLRRDAMACSLSALESDFPLMFA